MRLRGGPFRQPHFYHLTDSHSCRHSKKTITHLRLQQKLALLLAGTMEAPFPTIRRIADVYSPSQQLVIEIQCSPISRQEMEERNRAYASLGLRTLWILLERRFGRHLFPFPHYFTNGRIIYDRYGKQRLSVDLSQEIPLPPRLPPPIRGRSLAFYGDLSHLILNGHLTVYERPFLRSLLRVAVELLTQ